VSTRATYTDEEAMTSLHIDDTVDLSNMSNRILEKYEVHLLDLWQHVVADKLLVEIFSKLGEIGHFLIDLHAFVHEVDEEGVVTICCAMLSIVHLEDGVELFIQVSLELVSIIERVKSILENSEDLMGPELENLLFSFVEVLVSLIQTLEHL
jgi:hypothetical protein